MKEARATEELYRGHLPDCLRHFGSLFNARIPRRHKGRSEALEPMANFFGASVQTVRRWMDDESYALPKGELKLKLMYYLSLHGYKIIELKRMPEQLCNLAELIGFSVLSGKEVASRLGYHDAQQVYAIISGHDGMSKEKQDLVWDIWKEKRDLLEAKKNESFAKSRLELIFRPVHVKVSLEDAKNNILEGALVFLENLPDDELSHFSDQILRLSSRVSALKEA